MHRLAFITLVVAAACNTSTDPYLLDHSEILAVRSEPAHAPPGSSVRIDVLVADEAGNAFVAAPDSLDAGGLIVQHQGDGWYVQSPAGMPSAPTANVAIEVDGQLLRATKQLVFADERPNPSIDTMQVDGSATQAIACAPGTKPALDVAVTGDGTYTYAWYTSLGKLEHYRSEAATFDANEAGDGLVAIVVRDDQGGVTWQIVPATVQ
jgi:hypothetical protein